MPRNSSGTMNLPAGNPVSGGSVIQSSWGNTTLADIAAETTDSLSRSGKGAMLAALKTPDGATTSPAFSFTNEPGSGWFRIAAGRIGAAILGVLGLEINSSGVIVAKGSLTLTEAADQTIGKTGGALTIQGSGSIVMAPGSAGAFSFDGATGNLYSLSSHTITGLPSPVNTSDVASKGYVDSGQGATAFTGKPTATATTGGDSATTLSTKGYVDTAVTSANSLTTTSTGATLGTGWSSGTTYYFAKQANGMVTAYLSFTASAGFGTSILTAYPTGFAPATHAATGFILADQTSGTGAILVARIANTGVTYIAGQTVTSGHTYEAIVTYCTT